MMEWIYFSISWVLLKWHSLFSWMGIGEWLATNWDWILATVFLVLTIRGVLFPVELETGCYLELVSTDNCRAL